jgi:hypothetical protein
MIYIRLPFISSESMPCAVYCMRRARMCCSPTLVYGPPKLVMHKHDPLGVLCADPKSSPPARQEARASRVASEAALFLCRITTSSLAHPYHYHCFVHAFYLRLSHGFQHAFLIGRVGAFSLYSCERSESDPRSRNSKKPDTCDFP